MTINRTGWKIGHSELGKTVYHNKSDSVFIANLDLHQPHGYKPNDKQYIVEAYGDRVMAGEDVDYWHYEDIDDALAKLISVMTDAP